jgi:phenol hydroxylase P2 protein
VNSNTPSNVFLILQSNEETRPIIDAIEIDNPEASISRQPAMVRIEAPGLLTVNRETIEEQVGRRFDLQALHINLVSLGGHVDEDEDRINLRWNN